MEEVVHKCVPETPNIDDIAAKLVDASSSTEPVPKFVNDEVKKNSLDNTKVTERFVKLAEAIDEKKIR